MESQISSIVKRTAYFILFFLIILALLGAAIWWSLKKGIELDRLSISSVEISKLSLQLDKGFILHLDQLKVIEKETSGAAIDLENLIPRIKKWGHLVQEIDINQLTVKDQVVGLTYRNGSFQVRGNTFTLEAAIAHELGIFHFDLSRLAITPYKINLSGKASYSRSLDKFMFSGGFESPWGTGDLSIAEQDGQVDVNIGTDEFTDLVAILEQFQLDRDLLTWLSQNISAQSYQVRQLKIHFPLNDLKNIGPENVSGTAAATSATVRFHPDLPPVQCDRINISYQSDRLSFALEKPMYKDISLTGSKVYIDHLVQGDSQLAINIATETQKNNDIVELLGAYNIHLKGRQVTGLTEVDLQLMFDLPEFDLNTRGTFTVSPGEWRSGSIPFLTEGMTIQLQNNIITIQEAEISYEDILHANVSGTIDASSLHAEIQGKVNRLNFSVGETPLLHASELPVTLGIEFSRESVKLNFDEFQTLVTLQDGTTKIVINSLKDIAPLVPPLQKLNFDEGHVQLTVKDLDHIQFAGEIAIPNTILSLNDKPVTQFQYHGTWNPHKTEIYINDNKIIASLSDKLTADFHDYLITVDTNTFQGKETTPSVPIPIEVTGPGTLLKVKEFSIPTQKFTFKANGSDISFLAQLKQGHFLFESVDDEINFVGTELDGKIAETFIRFADFSGGTLNVSLKGSLVNYKGFIEFNDVLVKDYLLMNNVLAFLNAIPALATLSTPGFDQDGYRIKEGIVHFDLHEKILTIHQLRADGTTVNVEAEGWVNFNDRTIKQDMELITLKDYSNIISKLPIAGYAILGEEGTLSTSLKINGSLDDPHIKTYLARDIIMSPVNVIKRTFQFPFHLYKNKGTKTPEIQEP